MALTDNLISYWKLDESSGNASDSVGSNTGTNTNTVTYSAGKLNNGAVFVSASSQRFDCGASTDLSFSSDFTYGCWAKTSTGSVGFMSRTGTGGTYNTQLQGTGFFQGYCHLGGVDYFARSSSTWNDNNWHYFVAVFSASAGIKLYVDGIEVSYSHTQGAFTISTITPATQYIGFQAQNSIYMNGSMDEVGIWSRALTADEVSQLYNSGNGTQYPFQIILTILDTLNLSETSSYLRSRLSTSTDTLNLTESISLLKVMFLEVIDTLHITEAITTIRSLLSTISDTLHLDEVIRVAKKWTNQVKNSATFTNKTKNTSTWTNRPKN